MSSKSSYTQNKREKHKDGVSKKSEETFILPSRKQKLLQSPVLKHRKIFDSLANKCHLDHPQKPLRKAPCKKKQILTHVTLVRKGEGGRCR